MNPSSPLSKAQPSRNWEFRAENFTILPNTILNLVLAGTLYHRDLLTYAFLLGRHEAMHALKKQDYSAMSEARMAAFLGCKERTLRSSIKRLLDAGIIERKDTAGNTRTRVLVTVNDGKIVTGARQYPKRERKRPVTVCVDFDVFEDSAVW